MCGCEIVNKRGERERGGDRKRERGGERVRQRDRERGGKTDREDVKS